jgi:hypothetical protein
MSRATAILSGKERTPLVLIKHSPEQSATPLLRYAIDASLKSKLPLLLISILHPPSVFVDQSKARSTLNILDFTSRVPGYLEADENEGIHDSILACCSKSKCPIYELETVLNDHSHWPLDDYYRLYHYTCRGFSISFPSLRTY